MADVRDATERLTSKRITASTVEKGYNLFILDNLDALTSEDVAEAIASLPLWRREKVCLFKHEQGRKECAYSYLLLCQALQKVYGMDVQPEFSYGEHGKPFLKDYADIHFNLSHCRNAIACAVSDRPVGIDVERIGRFKESVARHVLNDAEYHHVVTSSAPDEEFTRLWTQKEAIVKLTGRGIDDDLKNLLSKYNNVSVHTDVYSDKGYVVSVATFL